MNAISLGRIITKIMGREAGRRAVVTQIIDKSFVEVSGPYELTGVKRRRVNISHIEPSQYSLKITKSDNSDEILISKIDENKEIKEFMSKKL
jgi:large subunit ribosomal protein L14e